MSFTASIGSDAHRITVPGRILERLVRANHSFGKELCFRLSVNGRLHYCTMNEFHEGDPLHALLPRHVFEHLGLASIKGSLSIVPLVSSRIPTVSHAALRPVSGGFPESGELEAAMEQCRILSRGSTKLVTHKKKIFLVESIFDADRNALSFGRLGEGEVTVEFVPAEEEKKEEKPPSTAKEVQTEVIPFASMATLRKKRNHPVFDRTHGYRLCGGVAKEQKERRSKWT